NPEIDAGLIAMNLTGQQGIGNSARVERRPDKGFCQRGNAQAQLAILHNAIAFLNSRSDDVADLAWGVLTGQAMPVRFLHLYASAPLRRADHDRTYIDKDGAIIAIETANAYLWSAT